MDEIKDLKQQLTDQGAQLDAITAAQTETATSLSNIDGDIKTLSDKIAALEGGSQPDGSIVVSATDFAELKATADATSAKFQAVAAKAKELADQSKGLADKTPESTAPSEPTPTPGEPV